MLYIYVIQERASPPEVYSSHFFAATRCQSHIAAIAEKGSLSERYCLVLEELRIEALRQTRRTHSTMTGLGVNDGHLQENEFVTASVPTDDYPSVAANYADVIGEAAIDLDSVPDSAFADYLGWDQFASMVSSGLGNFDTSLDDSLFKL